jgi:hypothetical protein
VVCIQKNFYSGFSAYFGSVIYITSYEENIKDFFGNIPE